MTPYAAPMAHFPGSLLNIIAPPAPDKVRDEMILLNYTRLRSQVPLLYVSLLLIVAAAAVSSDGDFPPLLRWGAPLLIGLLIFGRLLVWLGRRGEHIGLEQAYDRVRSTYALVAGLIGLSSLWCVVAWYNTASIHQPYVPMFMALSSLVVAFSFSHMRGAAMRALVIGLVPISTALLLSGDPMNQSMGSAILITGALVARTALQRHAGLVETLLLQCQMRELANTDMLTGLPNRRAFFGEVEAEIASGAPIAIAVLDLDGFKPVNDRLGHLVGDELLRIVADRLQAQTGTAVTLARIGGDEFAVLFRNATDAGIVSARATGIIAALAVPCTISGRRIAISASMGIAHFPRDGATLHNLFSAADQALYRAKADGPAQVRSSMQAA